MLKKNRNIHRLINIIFGNSFFFTTRAAFEKESLIFQHCFGKILLDKIYKCVFFENFNKLFCYWKIKDNFFPSGWVLQLLWQRRLSFRFSTLYSPLNFTANFKVKYTQKKFPSRLKKTQIHRKSESKICLPKNLEFLHSLSFLLPSLKVIFFSVSIMFSFSEKATKFEKNLPPCIWRYSVTSNFKWKIFPNFVPFSKRLNFKIQL